MGVNTSPLPEMNRLWIPTSHFQNLLMSFQPLHSGTIFSHHVAPEGSRHMVTGLWKSLRVSILVAARSSSQADLRVHTHLWNFGLIPNGCWHILNILWWHPKQTALTLKLILLLAGSQSKPLQRSLAHLCFSGTDKGCGFNDIPKMTWVFLPNGMVLSFLPPSAPSRQQYFDCLWLCGHPAEPTDQLKTNLDKTHFFHQGRFQIHPLWAAALVQGNSTQWQRHWRVRFAPLATSACADCGELGKPERFSWPNWWDLGF